MEGRTPHKLYQASDKLHQATRRLSFHQAFGQQGHGRSRVWARRALGNAPATASTTTDGSVTAEGGTVQLSNAVGETTCYIQGRLREAIKKKQTLYCHMARLLLCFEL